MSFDIVTRSPTPKQLSEAEEDVAVKETGGDDEKGTETFMEHEKKKQWGKAQANSKFRDELERQRYSKHN